MKKCSIDPITIESPDCMHMLVAAGIRLPLTNISGAALDSFDSCKDPSNRAEKVQRISPGAFPGKKKESDSFLRFLSSVKVHSVSPKLNDILEPSGLIRNGDESSRQLFMVLGRGEDST